MKNVAPFLEPGNKGVVAFFKMAMPPSESGRKPPAAHISAEWIKIQYIRFVKLRPERD